MIVIIVGCAAALVVYRILDSRDDTEEVIANAWKEED